MGFARYVELAWGDEKKESVAAIGNLTPGTRGVTPDGRVFRYSSAGEALGAGKLIQDPLAVANEDMGLAIQAAAAIGDTTIKVTTGGAVAVDLYKDGYIYINDGPGEGHLYRIKGNTVTTGAATMTVTLEDGETVRQALTTADSKAGLKKPPYQSMLLYNTTPDGIPRGLAPIEVTSAYFFWAQTWGDCAGLIDGVVVLGKAVVPGLNISGSFDAHVTTGDNSGDVGWVNSPIAATTEYGHLFLTIAP
jgi:hypothetical protein